MRLLAAICWLDCVLAAARYMTNSALVNDLPSMRKLYEETCCLLDITLLVPSHCNACSLQKKTPETCTS